MGYSVYFSMYKRGISSSELKVKTTSLSIKESPRRRYAF